MSDSRVIVALADPSIRSAVTSAIAEKGIAVREAEDMLSVLRSLTCVRVDLLVLDLALCAEMADEVVGLIRTHAPETKILACTWNSSPQDAEVVEKGLFFYAAGMSAEQIVEVALAGLMRGRNR